MADRRGPVFIGLVAVVAIAVATAFLTAEHRPAPVTGRVIDLAGDPVVGATITMGGATGRSDQTGAFTIASDAGEGWIRADAPGYLPRLRAIAPGRDVALRLTPDDGHTVSIVLGGDVMFGRRFFDPNEDGDRSDGLLQQGSTAADHARLLAGVAPALQAADVAIVNLETPLLAAPYVDPMRLPAAGFHPAKEFVFASLPVAATALRMSGVDVVGIGNNHLYDALDAGVVETLESLDLAGFGAGTGRTGGGASETIAWTPALVNVRGTAIAVLACTTIDGHETPPTYVATDAKGGAALCTDEGIRRAVTAARTRTAMVIVMLHGGFEYGRDATGRIEHLSEVAHAAGAALVVDHHPHVIGGFRLDATGLTAWTIGNLLFDQTVWPTFETFLLTVHVRDGRPIRAIVDPLIMDEFRPRPIVGDLAEHVARDAAGWAPGDFVVDDGSVEIGLGALTVERQQVTATGAEDGSILRLPGATAIDPVGYDGVLEVGRDLLWTGDFEDEESDGVASTAPLWLGDGDGRQRSSKAAASGQNGIRLARSGSNVQDVILAPTHRIPVVAGSHLSFTALVRLGGSGRSAVQLSWFNDLRGESSSRTTVGVPAAGGWQRIRIDVTVPQNAIAVLPILRLAPPTAGVSSMDVDEVRLIDWRPASEATLATDYLRLRGPVTFDTILTTARGSTEVLGDPIPLRDTALTDAGLPEGLPPGPSTDPTGDD